MRQSRKQEHLKVAVQVSDGPCYSGFDQIFLVPNCLPDMALKEVDLSTSIAGLPLPHPVIINAITGGSSDVEDTNKELALIAQHTGCAIAVGSQFSAIESSQMRHSYQVVRKYNSGGKIFANLGAHATFKQAQTAIDMLEADALQIHLNVAQEMSMREGDRDFKGYLDNISEIAAQVSVPVYVKEVGFGIAKEQAELLCQTGIRGIDVGGAGGTNFIAIEGLRFPATFFEERMHWGLPTVLSALEVKSVLPATVSLIVSGGVRTPLDVCKSLALGAHAVALAGPILKKLKNGRKKVEEWLLDFLDEIRLYMVLTGTKRIENYTSVPLVFDPKIKHWMQERQIRFRS